MPVPRQSLTLVLHEFHWDARSQLPLRLIQGWHPDDVTAASTGPAQRTRAGRPAVPTDAHALVVLSEHPDWGTAAATNAYLQLRIPRSPENVESRPLPALNGSSAAFE
jgi:hypothetical protein